MTGPLSEVDLTILLPFTCGAVIAVWSTVVIAGFLPLRAGPAAGAGPMQVAMIFGATAAIAMLILILTLTIPLLPTAVAAIAAGLAVLAGPFLVQPIPRGLRESRLAPVAVVALSLAVMVVLPNPF